MKISLRVSQFLSRHNFQNEIFKGYNYVKKNVDGVKVLILCTPSDDALYLYKIS